MTAVFVSWKDDFLSIYTTNKEGWIGSYEQEGERFPAGAAL
jgi:hypothetical protein